MLADRAYVEKIAKRVSCTEGNVYRIDGFNTRFWLEFDFTEAEGSPEGSCDVLLCPNIGYGDSKIPLFDPATVEQIETLMKIFEVDKKLSQLSIHEIKERIGSKCHGE